jgi:hypothetical protein
MMKIPTLDNYSDIMTKATGTGTFSRHVGSLMTGAGAAARTAAAKPDVDSAAKVLRQTGLARPRAVARAAASDKLDAKPRLERSRSSARVYRRSAAASRG